MKRGHIFYLGIIFLVYLLMEVIVNPMGNFPLNDDWAFARPVSLLLQTGTYSVPDGCSPTLIGQVLWGALFSVPFGFSFTVLRISDCFLGLAGIIALYFSVYRLMESKKMALFCALLLLINPMYFSLSNTFMTDVPFVAYSLLAVYFLFRNMESGKLKFLMLGAFFSCLSVLVRQCGIVIPLAFVVIMLIKQRKHPKQWILYALPAIIAYTALKLYIHYMWRKGSGFQPYNGNEEMDMPYIFRNMVSIIAQAETRGGYLLIYSGLFLLPLLFFTLPKAISDLSFKQKIAVVIFTIVFIPLFFNLPYFPFGNIINNGYIGPKTLKDITLLHINDGGLFSPFISKSIHCIGVFGGVLLLINTGASGIKILQSFKANKVSVSTWLRLFAGLCLALYCILLFIPNFFFDRYLLFVFPLLLIFIADETSDKRMTSIPAYVCSAIVAISLLYFTVFATHDYLQWNRTRWLALDCLTNDLKISPNKIDGGYEFNGWILGKWFPARTGKSWWYVDDDEYIVSFGAIDGYTIMKKFSYRNYLPFESKNIFILQRKEK